MRSLQELRRATGPVDKCARRALHRASRLKVYCSWTPQCTPTPISEANSSDALPNEPSIDKAINAEEDFLRRAQKMQRRIAKLKLLREKIAQLKEEKDFLRAYKEVEASASDSDSESEESAPGPSSRPAASSPSRGPALPPSASAEELRIWVAQLVERSASRAAAAAAAVTSTAPTGSGADAGAASGLAPGPGSGLELGSITRQPSQQLPRASGSGDGAITAAAGAAGAGGSEAVPGGGVLRRYSVRYSSAPPQPTLLAEPGSSPPQPVVPPPESQQPNTASQPTSPHPPPQPPSVARSYLRDANLLPLPVSAASDQRGPAPPPAVRSGEPPLQSSPSPSPSPSALSAQQPQQPQQQPRQPEQQEKQLAPPPGPAVGSAVSAAAPGPARDPNAELRATTFPENLTSTNPYTLYDMPLPPLPIPKAWQTAAERRAEAEAASSASSSIPASPAAGGGGAGRADRPRDLVFVTAEAAPWSKTGGLGDVMGSLPRALAARGHRVMVVTPRYLAPSTAERYAALRDTGVRARLDLGPARQGGGGLHEVGFFHLHSDGVDWVFVDHMSYHREGTPYGNSYGTYGDNLFRFALLCQAACEAPLLLHIGGYHYGTPPGLPYGQNVTFIANDWHAGLVPVYVAAKYRRHGVFRDARCLLALHNLAHQGAHPPQCFPSLGLPGEWYGALEWVDTGELDPEAQPGGRTTTINILKAALVTSDRLVTVSPAYAWEICDSAGEQGMGLGSLLRQRAPELAGIVNGIDVAEWDPRTDPYISRNYHEGSLGGKGLCKAALQEQLRLPVDPAAPLLGFIGRLDYQKGPDLVLGALKQLVAAGCQVVLLGSGAPDYEAAFRAAQSAYPANVRAHVGFSVPLSHRILAAADILLMPSRFEPCGLNQMYAMRYGTVPVAHGTGGLRDTIDDVDPFVGEAGRQAVEDVEELFATGLAWGKRTAARSADDPSTNNADYYRSPFQDYFGASGRYGPVDEDDDDAYDMYGDPDERNGDEDVPLSGPGSAAPSLGGGSDGVGGSTGRRRQWRRQQDPGSGWTFAPANEEALLDAVTAALTAYERYPDKWRRVQLAGMRRDFSWGRAARQWEAVIEQVNAAVAYCK